MGGVAELWMPVSQAAAGSLATLLERLGETESAARAVGTDLQHDDAAVGQLLSFLGEPAEAVRRELEVHPEPRVRLRALKAVLSTRRSPELVQRMLADPSPLVRIEAATSGAAWDELPKVLLSEAAPEVRLAIARELRAGTRHADVVLEALARERDPDVRHALVECLPPRWRAGARITEALRQALDAPRADTRRFAAGALKRVNDAQVGKAIAARIPVETDRLALYELLSYEHLARHGKELPAFIASLLETTADAQLRSAALHALVRFDWRAQPLVVPLAAHATAEVRRAAHFFLSKHESVPTLVQLRALKAGSQAARRDLQQLVDRVAAAVAARGAELPTPAPAEDDGGTVLEVDAGSAARASAPGEGAPSPASGPAEPAAANAQAVAESPQLTARALAERGAVAEALPGAPATHRELPCSPGTTLVLNEGETPARVSFRLACATCGAHARVRLPVRFQSMDDDRFAARETAYEAGGWMNCPACAAAWCVEQAFDLVEPRDGRARTLDWRDPGRQQGARLVNG